MELVAHFRDGLIDELVAICRGHLLGDHVAGGGDCHGHGAVAHFLDSTGFGRGDLFFGGLQTARDGPFQVLLGLVRGGGRFGLGVLDDASGLVLNLFLLALIRGEQRLAPLPAGPGPRRDPT